MTLLQNSPTFQTIDGIEVGRPFEFFFRGVRYIGIKTAPRGGASMVAVIWPGHPQRPGEAGIFAANVLAQKSLAELPDASIVPSHDMEDIELDEAIQQSRAGSIVLSDKGQFMLLVSGSEVLLLNLVTFELSNAATSIHAQIRGWRLVRKVLDQFETICSFPAAKT